MNLGTLKLSSVLLLSIIVASITSCSYKDFNKFIQKKNKEIIIEDKNSTKLEDNIKVIKNNKAINDNQIVKKDKEINNVHKKIYIKHKSEYYTKELNNSTKTIIKLNQKNTNEKDFKVNDNEIKHSEIFSKIKKSTKLNNPNLDDFRFDFIKKGVQDDNTFLVVAGIQGDEPGGFMAASLLSTHYSITKGSVWIVPNLNFYSIIKRSRGPFGDMNRKFANLSKDDPEYKIVQRIKKYITNKDVKLILNLHDGSGFYRETFIDKNHQPLKWGQSSVIDQEILPGVKEYANTKNISDQIVEHLNKYLLKEEDIYRTKNTHTRFNKTHEEMEMAKTLTYFAVKNGKSAFGHETSKSLNTTQRVYYKLLAMEKYMDIMGIEYKRDFDMNIDNIEKILKDDISIKFDDTNVKMPLKNIRDILTYFPINKNGIIKYLPSNPLIKIIKMKNEYIIYYGNNKLTTLRADYSEHISFKTKINFLIDGKNKEINFGDTININDNFLIKRSDFRVNVIGYKNDKGLETDVKIYKKEFLKRYSIEKNANIYRIEFYKNNKFVGMILAKYK